MRIAILGTRGFPSFYGGFETAVRELAPYFAKSGHQTFVYSRRAACKDNPQIRNLRVIYSPYLDKKSLGTITHIISSFVHIIFSKPDIILGFNVTCAIIGPIAKILKIPLVINVDGLEWRRQKWGKIAKFAYFFFAYLASKYSTCLVSDSKHIQEYWYRTFDVPSNFIAYGGQVCELDSLIDEKYVSDLLYVARFVPENSFELFLNLVKLLPAETKVFMVGSYSNATEKQLEEFSSFLLTNTNVTYLGHISNDQELFKYWNNAQVYFHGHTVGGTNPALVQAMHCGARILARETIYNREVLGDAGYYFDPDLPSLYQKLQYLLLSKETSRDIRDMARIRAKDLYSWEEISYEYLSLLQSS
jgi:glycosyltransferase involved in cell wall biosynthesis